MNKFILLKKNSKLLSYFEQTYRMIIFINLILKYYIIIKNLKMINLDKIFIEIIIEFDLNYFC
jgi:hypothetical protein